MNAAGLIFFAIVLFFVRPFIPWIGRVSRVVDGDSLECGTGPRMRRIRLAGIDAPERSQAHGLQAKAALAELVKDRLVLFVPGPTDMYGRTVCHVLARGVPVSWTLAARGHAWSDGLVAWFLVLGAQIGRKGLWADHKPIRPRAYRDAMKLRRGMRLR